MFKTILVPLDGTPQAAAALPLARTLARVTDGSLLLVRVAADSGMMIEAERYLGVVTAEFTDINVRGVVRYGRPAEQIVVAARDEPADLIVMATHGRAGLQRAIVGSVAEHVLTHTPVPVVLVKPGGKRVTHLKTLLVPIDGTAGAALALGAAVDLARSARTRVVLIEAVEPYPFWVYGSNFGVTPTAVDPAWDEDMLKAARSYVDGLAAGLCAAGLVAEGDAVMGQAVEAIQEKAYQTDADLIVMSTHAFTGPARALLGSTADALVRTARRPVLLIRRPGGALDYPAAELTAAAGSSRVTG